MNYARRTKAQLIEHINTLERELEAEHAVADALRTELAAYQVAERPSRQALSPQAARPEFVPSKPLTPFRTACEAAKAMAMRTGKSVVVGG